MIEILKNIKQYDIQQNNLNTFDKELRELYRTQIMTDNFSPDMIKMIVNKNNLFNKNIDKRLKKNRIFNYSWVSFFLLYILSYLFIPLFNNYINEDYVLLTYHTLFLMIILPSFVLGAILREIFIIDKSKKELVDHDKDISNILKNEDYKNYVSKTTFSLIKEIDSFETDYDKEKEMLKKYLIDKSYDFKFDQSFDIFEGLKDLLIQDCHVMQNKLDSKKIASNLLEDKTIQYNNNLSLEEKMNILSK